MYLISAWGIRCFKFCVAWPTQLCVKAQPSHWRLPVLTVTTLSPFPHLRKPTRCIMIWG
jgi:hypothetical protein